MGNSPPTGGLRVANTDCSYVVTVGQSVIIQFRGRNADKGNEEGENTESWGMVYNPSGKRKCLFSLSRTLIKYRNTHLDDMLDIVIQDFLAPVSNRFFFAMTLQKHESGLILINKEYSDWLSTHGGFKNRFINVTPANAHGEITTTAFDIYGNNDETKGLIVWEYKGRSEDEKLHTVSVAHYYLDDGVDVGLSVAGKRIRVLGNGNFDFVVDGPQQHPVDALAYMFNQVLRTKTWKPTYCPHCANRYIDERQSESESDIDNVPAAPPLHGGRQRNAPSIVSNPGWFKGKDIGNTYIKHFYGRKI